MKRTILLVLTAALAGCDNSVSDPHELVECSSVWSGRPGQCELACAELDQEPAQACNVTFNGVTGPCNPTYVTSYDGHAGCCLATDSPSAGTEPIVFVECE